MKFLVNILLALLVGSQILTSDAQGLTTRIRIQSCSDNQFIGIPPKNGPPTTTAAPTTTTEAPTTETPVDPTTTGPTTTAAPVPVEPVGGGGGSTTIIYWQINWGSAIGSGGSVIVAVDTTTSEKRCLGQSGDGIGVADSVDLPTSLDYAWNFVSVFDSVTWTYKYKISNKSGRCLQKARGGKFTMSSSCLGSTEYLFNILSN